MDNDFSSCTTRFYPREDHFLRADVHFYFVDLRFHNMAAQDHGAPGLKVLVDAHLTFL